MNGDKKICEHDVVGKHCFRCKRPDLAGTKPVNLHAEPAEDGMAFQMARHSRCSMIGAQIVLDHILGEEVKDEMSTPDYAKLLYFLRDEFIAEDKQSRKETIEEILGMVKIVSIDNRISEDKYEMVLVEDIKRLTDI